MVVGLQVERHGATDSLDHRVELTLEWFVGKKVEGQVTDVGIATIQNPQVASQIHPHISRFVEQVFPKRSVLKPSLATLPGNCDHRVAGNVDQSNTVVFGVSHDQKLVVFGAHWLLFCVDESEVIDQRQRVKIGLLTL